MFLCLNIWKLKLKFTYSILQRSVFRNSHSSTTASQLDLGVLVISSHWGWFSYLYIYCPERFVDFCWLRTHSMSNHLFYTWSLPLVFVPTERLRNFFFFFFLIQELVWGFFKQKCSWIFSVHLWKASLLNIRAFSPPGMCVFSRKLRVRMPANMVFAGADT